MKRGSGIGVRQPRPLLVLVCVLALSFGVQTANAEEDAEPDPPDAIYSDSGADSCLLCHRDSGTAAIFSTPHGVPSDHRSPFGPGQLQCESCHGPSGEHSSLSIGDSPRPPPTGFGASDGLAELNSYCVNCHENELVFDWHDSAHNMNSVACADCHLSHGLPDPALAPALRNSVCADCHPFAAAESFKAYSHFTGDDKMYCDDCHSAHGSDAPVALVRNNVVETCWDCHADKRGPYLWEHPPAAENCAYCHAPHGSNLPGMLIQRAPFLCLSCHSEAGHPSISPQRSGNAPPSAMTLIDSCLNCHSQVHGSNHPSGQKLTR